MTHNTIPKYSADFWSEEFEISLHPNNLFQLQEDTLAAQMGEADRKAAGGPGRWHEDYVHWNDRQYNFFTARRNTATRHIVVPHGTALQI